MKRLHNGVLIFDVIDIILISFLIGNSCAHLIRKYKSKTNIDPIVKELKKECRVIAVNIDGKPLKFPLVRGGDDVSIIIKNKKFARLMRLLLTARKNQRLLQFLQANFTTLNLFLTATLDFRIAVGGSLDYTQIVLISGPSMLSGYLVAQIVKNPLISVFLPLTLLYGRGIQDIQDPYESCRLLCKAAEQIHSRELAIEMSELNSLVGETFYNLPLICVEEKSSLVQRFKLRKLVESEIVQNRVQYFSEFIKKFPECDGDSKIIFEQMIGKITE